MAVNWL